MRPAPTIVSIGNFDGVHTGHAAILRRATVLVDALGATGGTTALAFDPHPLTVLDPERSPARLTTFAQRAELLKQAGANTVIRLEPQQDLLGLTPEAFLERVVAMHNPRAIVEGTDFRFGRDRAGDLDTLRALCKPRGIEVHAVPAVAVGLSDNTAVTASSTMARWLIERGRVRDAWALLTRPHRLTGAVVQGDRRGRTLGFPTANIETPNLLPADGVYATVATMPDGSKAAGALSVGVKPQFGEHARTAEVYLLDMKPEAGAPNLPGLPEYGWPLTLDLVGWIREQMRFPSLDGLLAQIERDCSRARAIFESVTTEQPQHHLQHQHGTMA